MKLRQHREDVKWLEKDACGKEFEIAARYLNLIRMAEETLSDDYVCITRRRANVIEDKERKVVEDGK